MEVDRELIEGCLKDMRFAHEWLVGLQKTFPGLSHFMPLSMLSLRILELEEILGP